MILDANVRDELANETTPAARAAKRWVQNGHGRIVIGGSKTREELRVVAVSRTRLHSDNRWGFWEQLLRTNRIIDSGHTDEAVDSVAGTLRKRRACASDDAHIIALAQVSGARLLFSNDRDLQTDFKDGELVNNPRGKIYRSRHAGEVVPFGREHKRLLQDRNLCTAA